MAIYKKRDPHYAAHQITLENADSVAAWCNGVVNTDPTAEVGSQVIIHVKSADGRNQMAFDGDYVIKMPDGKNFTISNPSWFEANFEVVE